MSEAVLTVVLEASLRATAVALLVAVVLLLTRVRSSSVRHAAWSSVLLAMLLMPVLPRLMPAVRVPMPVATGPWPAMASIAIDPQARNTAATDVVNDRRPVGTSMPSTAVAGGTEAAQSSPASPRRSLPWSWIGLGVYLAGLAVMLGRLVIGWRQSRGLIGDGGTAVRESAEVAAPITVGVMHPKVVMPADWRSWPVEQRRAVLAHEHAHITRRDPLVAFLAAVNRSIFWFHPLAWWLERTLARAAEHACDAAAVRALGTNRNAAYAEVLLDMADHARRSGGRLRWQGVGVNGRGLLGQRIERILSGDFFVEVSQLRKAAVTLLSAAAIFIAVSCHRQPPAAPPLTEDPAVTAALAADQARSALWAEARALTADQAKALEATVDANPEDTASREKLLVFYNTSGQKVLGWNAMVAARRKQVLWLIEHHPESRLMWEASIQPESDPAGYAAARQLWVSYLKRPSVDPDALHHAFSFFAGIDNVAAEQVSLRGQSIDPTGGGRVVDGVVSGPTWSSELGRLYARAMLGLVGRESGISAGKVSVEAARSAFAIAARRKLDETRDVSMLLEAAYVLRYRALQSSNDAHLDFEPAVLARHYVEQAVRLDPQSVRAQQSLAGLKLNDVGQRAYQFTKGLQGEEQYAKVMGLAEGDRFTLLPRLADSAYMSGENFDYNLHDASRAKVEFDLCRRYATAELELAPKFRNDSAYSVNVHEANLALGTLAWRDGRGDQALRYLQEAANVPPSDSMKYVFPILEYRLTDSLLKSGVREPVAAYYEKVAALEPLTKDRYLKDAAAVRAGRMPEFYQRRLAQK